MENEWFRNTIWNDEIAANFAAKLARARKTSQHQYLRIQAGHIREFDPNVALTLLDQFFALGEDGIQMASAWLQRAECFAQLGKPDLAIESALQAIEWEQKVPNVTTQVKIWFPLYVAQQGRSEYFDLAMELVESRRAVFPKEVFRQLAASALIARHRNVADAKDYAKKALEAVNVQHSPFSNHPHLGLVDEGEDRDIIKKLKQIA